MRRVVIADYAAVSPYGLGKAALLDGLLSGNTAIELEELDGISPTPLARCRALESVTGEDRTITLLRTCIEELEGSLSSIRNQIHPTRIGIAAATSKGAFLSMAESGDFARTRILDALPSAVTDYLAKALNAQGPQGTSVAACATGLANILQAAQWIALDYADVIIAGSSEASLTPLYIQSFLALGAHSKHGSFPFDQRHSGFVAGEGAGLFLLTTPEIRAKFGLTPIAEIVGGQLGSEASHLTASDETGVSLSRFLQRTLSQAGMNAKDVDILCCHGTSTKNGDTAEANGLSLVYTDGMTPPILSFKGAFGHLMGAAGSVELAACLLSMEHNCLFPAVGYETAAEASEHLTFPRTAQKIPPSEVLMKWSIGFGGHLASIILKRP